MDTNNSSSCGVKDIAALPAPSTSTATPTALIYALFTAWLAVVPLAAWWLNVEKIPMILTLVPGATLSTKYRSHDMEIDRGISPVGTISGLSCNFNGC
jgi:hypothetical protein